MLRLSTWHLIGVTGDGGVSHITFVAWVSNLGLLESKIG